MKNRVLWCISLSFAGALAFPTVTFGQIAFTIGGSLFADCTDPIVGEAGVTVNVVCDSGFADSTTSTAPFGLWQIANVPEDTCSVTVVGFCRAFECPRLPPCSDTVTIPVDPAHQPQNQSLGFERDRCGNGIVDPGEACDDAGESASCNADCTLAVCGDGQTNVTAGETCDDGNTNGGDGCSATCLWEANLEMVGGAVFADCSNPLGSGRAGVTVNVTCDSGFADSTTSTAPFGIWQIANVPEDTCIVTVEGLFCSVDSVCPPDPCSNTVSILVDAANQAQNQSLAFWECTNLDCWFDFASCMTDPDVPASAECQVFDSDLDGDVDLTDAAAFQRAFTGP